MRRDKGKWLNELTLAKTSTGISMRSLSFPARRVGFFSGAGEPEGPEDVALPGAYAVSESLGAFVFFFGAVFLEAEGEIYQGVRIRVPAHRDKWLMYLLGDSVHRHRRLPGSLQRQFSFHEWSPSQHNK